MGKRLGASHSTFVNACTWALMLTGRMVKLDDDEPQPRAAR